MGLQSAQTRGLRRAAEWQITLGAVLLVASGLLLLRALGLWVGDAIVWPVFAAVVGALLIWQESSRLPWLSLPRETARRGASGLAPAGLGAQALGRALGTVAVGASLVLGASLLFLWANGAISKVSSAVLTVVAVLVAFTLILAPLWVRVLRSLTAERAERERSQERTAVAAHLHDSVLQTLALIQRRAQEPREVAALARRQERELRAWLSGAEHTNTGTTFTTAIEDAATDVEVAHGVLVEVVVVGGRPLDEAGEAVVAAAREAIVNAAKFAGESPIAVYAELTRERVEIFIRDRGPGFEPELVPVDRRGLRDSIIGRMTRYGGRATVRSAPGQGTEIALSLRQAVRA